MNRKRKLPLPPPYFALLYVSYVVELWTDILRLDIIDTFAKICNGICKEH